MGPGQEKVFHVIAENFDVEHIDLQELNETWNVAKFKKGVKYKDLMKKAHDAMCAHVRKDDLRLEKRRKDKKTWRCDKPRVRETAQSIGLYLVSDRYYEHKDYKLYRVIPVSMKQGFEIAWAWAKEKAKDTLDW
jgi:hypothetical protein